MPKLTEILELDIGQIPSDRREALRIAEQVWQARGCPCDTQGLAAAIEAALGECKRAGAVYPKMLLRRKHELLRGEFSVDPVFAAAHHRLPTETESEAVEPGQEKQPSLDIERIRSCEICGGRGFVVESDKAQTCSCFKAQLVQ